MTDRKNPDLSIIILNFNVKDLLLNCLKSVFKSKTEKDNWQIIVVDNASMDGSAQAVKKEFPETELIANKINLGFSQGNNVGVHFAKAPVVLFLNPDTVVVSDAIQKSYKYLMSNPDIGALTCKVKLPDGRLDYSCHRGFPTPWNSLSYFTGLSRIFPKMRLFTGYSATYLDMSQAHEIDSASGAFLMVRKIAGDQTGWWDKDYFFNGEDIEFCYSLKEKGWKIFFYPDGEIIHYKGSSSGLWSTAKGTVQKETKLKAAGSAAEAMRIFFMKHYYKKSPPLLRDLVLFGISSLEQYRKFKIRTGIKYERS